MSIEPGTKLGSYVVQDFIGQGAMGVVYRAYHAQLERTGAVKVLQALGADSDSTARFRREAQSIARMRHPNVLNVFDFGEYEGTPYMIVEYVDGGNLAAVVKSGPLDRKAALGYLRGIADALDYAHSRGIIHRDVKPANVLLGAESTPILADFGLAKLMQSNSVKSVTGVTTGTPAYMAPEQVTGSHIGPAADRYSLAVMAYEMLTGFLPFDEGGILEVLYAHVHRTPALPSSRSSRLGPRVDEVVMRGLSKDPDARWDSCASFVAALEMALDPATRSTIEQTIAFAPPIPAVSAEPTPQFRPITPTVRQPAAPSIAATTAVEGAAFRGPDATIAENPPVITREGAVILKGTPKQRRSRRRALYVSIGAVALILVLLLGTAAFLDLTSPTTLSISKNPAVPGDVVTLTATHVPRNQAGVIELHSVLHTYPFRSDGNGNVRGVVTVPDNIEVGAHRLLICWGGTCYKEIVLHVVASVAFLPSQDSSPSPSKDPSASPAAGPTASPKPGSTPSASPRPTSTPKSTPPPSPKPSPTPCPAPASGAKVSVSPAPPAPIIVGVTKVAVAGTNFTPNKPVTVYYYPAGAKSPTQTMSATVSCAGGFTVTFTPGFLDPLGTAHVIATDAGGRSSNASFSIT